MLRRKKIQPLSTPIGLSAKGGRPRGFTIIELMVTVVIAAVLTAVALPNLRQFTARTVVRTEADAIAGALRNARAEAIRSRVKVSVCPSNIGTTTSSSSTLPVCNTTVNPGNWDVGWVVVANQSVSDGTAPTASNVRAFRSPTDTTIDVRSTGFSSNVVIFSPTGNLISSPGTITVKSTQITSIVATITVSQSGWIEAALP